MEPASLHPVHLSDLRSSGLSDETIAASGCQSAPPETTEQLLGFPVGPGLVFPFPGCTTSDKRTFCQVKPDTPFGKMKYISPKGEGCRLYVPPLLHPSILQTPSRPLYITEGCKKALKACQEGLICLALAGVDSWKDHRSPDGKSRPIPDLDRVAWTRRAVTIVYDSDAATKSSVLAAEWRLARELRDRGAVLSRVRLAAGDKGTKVGLDDYLCMHSVDTFCALEAEPVSHPAKATMGMPVFTEDLGAFLDRPLPEVHSIVGDGVITQGGMVLLIGIAGLGKTLLLTQLGLNVAGGSSQWLCGDLPIHVHGPVLYVNAEVAEVIFQHRLRLVLQQLSQGNPSIVQARKRFYPVSVRGSWRLDRSDGPPQLITLAQKVKPILIILDPLGPLHNWDENSAAEMGKLLNILLTVCQQTGACVLFAHHAGKGSQEGRADVHHARGSAVFGDRADTVMSLIRVGDQSEFSRLRLSWGKIRNGPAHAPMILTRGETELSFRASGQIEDIAEWMKSVLDIEGETDRTFLLDRYKEAGYSGQWYFRKALDALVERRFCTTRRDGFPSRMLIRPTGFSSSVHSGSN